MSSSASLPTSNATEPAPHRTRTILPSPTTLATLQSIQKRALPCFFAPGWSAFHAQRIGHRSLNRLWRVGAEEEEEEDEEEEEEEDEEEEEGVTQSARPSRGNLSFAWSDVAAVRTLTEQDDGADGQLGAGQSGQIGRASCSEGDGGIARDARHDQLARSEGASGRSWNTASWLGHRDSKAGRTDLVDDAVRSARTRRAGEWREAFECGRSRDGMGMTGRRGSVEGRMSADLEEWRMCCGVRRTRSVLGRMEGTRNEEGDGDGEEGEEGEDEIEGDIGGEVVVVVEVEDEGEDEVEEKEEKEEEVGEGKEEDEMGEEKEKDEMGEEKEEEDQTKMVTILPWNLDRLPPLQDD